MSSPIFILRLRDSILREFPNLYTYHLVDDSYHQAAARTHGDVGRLVQQVGEGNFETVAAGARVVVGLQCRIIGHVFDFDLVVNGNLFVVAHLVGRVGHRVLL